MDIPLYYLDSRLDFVYAKAWSAVRMTVCQAQPSTHLCQIASARSFLERTHWFRQSVSIFCLTTLLSITTYLVLGTIFYRFSFDVTAKKSPKFQANQISKEIRVSLWALLWLNILTWPIFLAQVRGYSRIYQIGNGNRLYEVLQYPVVLLFSDCAVYWLHRAFHQPYLFRRMHKHHHEYVIPTPFAAHAFHPAEAYVMSLPIYAYSFILPMSNVAQLFLFGLSFVWTFHLHDSRDQFHTVHHKSVSYNFGQFCSLFDRLGGTYKDPATFFRRVEKH